MLLNFHPSYKATFHCRRGRIIRGTTVLYYPPQERPPRAHHTCKKQGDFQQLHRDMFLQKCVVSSHHLKKKLHLKCAFANILLMSFIFNFKFLFCTCIIVIDFIFYLFHIEICEICITSTCKFPPFVSIKIPPCLKLDKLIVYL